MVQSQSLGNYSSHQLINDEHCASALAYLKKITQSIEITTLTKLLKVEVYVVGGLLRDIFSLSNTSSRPLIADLDLATSLTPEHITTILTPSGIKVIPTGITHGTISIVFPNTRPTACFTDNLQIQITTFRKPGARTSNTFSSSIEEDLAGRDFTINAMAYAANAETLIDPFNGLQDLRHNVLRAVTSAQDRFTEDPHRIMRMVRFGDAAGRTIADETLAQASQLAPRLHDVSMERIRDEFIKILLSWHPSKGLRRLRSLGILDWLIPEITPSYGLEQNEFHHEDVFEHTLTVIERSTPQLHVRLAALFHDLGKPHTLTIGEDGRRHFYLHEQKSASIAKEVMTRLRCSHADIKEVMLLVEYHMRPLNCGAPGARRLIRDLGDSYERWRELKIADAPPAMSSDEFTSQLSSFDSLISSERARSIASPYATLAISGNDILALGVPAGPAVGSILKELLEMVADSPEMNSREVLLEEAKRRMIKT